MKEILSNGVAGPKGMSVHILVDNHQIALHKDCTNIASTVLLNQMWVLPVLLELLKL